VNPALINLAAFQIGWFTCVLGAAYGLPLLGPGVVTLLLGLHLLLAPRPWEEIRLVGAAGAMGLCLDSLQAAAGLFSFSSEEPWSWISPLWMVALWVNFATTLHTSLRWLLGRYALAALLGALGGPLSYYAGARLGALTFPVDPAASFIVLALVWGVAIQLLLKLAEE
jgi:hypothetical protein